MKTHACTSLDRRGAKVPLLVMLVCLLLAMASRNVYAANTARVPCGACEERDRFVRLQTDAAERPAQPFSHPAHFSPEAWTVILKSVRVQSRSDVFPFTVTKGPVTPAFTDEDVEYLSITLSKAFALARPNEWVVFGLSSQRIPQLAEITTGGWFVENESLHLVLANYKEAVTLPSIRKLLWEEPLRPHSGSLYEFIPGTHLNLVPRQDQRSRRTTPQLPELSVAYKALLQTGMSGQPDIEPPVTPDGSSLSTLPSQRFPLEERLRQLRQLKEQGLITEAEYGAKKKQLLDGL